MKATKNNPKFLLIVIVLLFFTNLSNAQIADRVFKNAKIYTANDAQPFAEALAILGDSIIYVGTTVGVQTHVGTPTVVNDMQGRLMMPGIHDVHLHPMEASSPAGASCILDVNETDPENLGLEMQACNPAPNVNGWIMGWGHTIFTLLDATREPRFILDDYFPNTPVAIMEATSHSFWVNTKALQLMGITVVTPDPIGGHIVKDAVSGNPNGILLDNSGDKVLELALANHTTITTANYNGLVNYGLPELAKNGITSIVEGRTYWKRGYGQIWQDIKSNGLLTARVVLSPWVYPEDNDVTQIPALQAMYDAGDDMLRTTMIKCYSDGIIINATCKLHQPYDDNLGFPFTNGINYIDQVRLTNLITTLELTGYDFFVHSIGDAGTTETLDAIQAARSTNGNIGARHRITHLEIVQPSDFPRFAALNVTADVQVAGDFTQPSHWHDNDAMIGVARSSNIVPLKSMYNTGARITLSSDWDVSYLSPFVGMEHALTRAPQQLPDVETVIKAYTIKGAYTMRQEDKTGSLEVGKYADIIAVDQDIFTVPATQIGQTKVDLTMLGGREVYKSNNFPLSVESFLDDENFKIQLYPNITSDYTNIKFVGDIKDTFYISIFDMNGKLVDEVHHTHYGQGLSNLKIDLSHLGIGIYNISIEPESGTYVTTERLIISK
jgi:predicted amidohydrolase YtcJ